MPVARRSSRSTKRRRPRRTRSAASPTRAQRRPAPETGRAFVALQITPHVHTWATISCEKGYVGTFERGTYTFVPWFTADADLWLTNDQILGLTDTNLTSGEMVFTVGGAPWRLFIDYYHLSVYGEMDFATGIGASVYLNDW